MTGRKPAKVIKPVIFYNGLFHYVEDNVDGETDDAQFALFKVYNLARSFGELRKEIINLIGESTTVTFIDDFKGSMDESYVSVNANVKIKIWFRSQKHRDVIENLRSSQTIKDLTQNGFADWVPLDNRSYINIERNSTCEKRGNVLTTTKLRSFDNEIDSSLLKMIIDEICENKIDLALEKLFPGPNTRIHREINDITMTVVVFEIHYHFDEEMGKLFVEVLNSLIEDRKIEARSKEDSLAYSAFMYSLFVVVRNLMHLDELYGEFQFPSWTPFITQPKLKEVRQKLPVRNTLEEDDFLLITEEFTNLDEPLKRLRPLVQQLQEGVETAQRKIHDNIMKWKNPRRTSNTLFYSSMATMLAIPTMYLANRSVARTVSSNRLKVSIGCLLTIALGIWSKNSHHNFHKAVKFTRQVDPLLGSTKSNVDSLARCLDEITINDKSKIEVDDYEFKGRKVILKQLFHKFVSAHSVIRISFTVAS